MHWFLNYFYHPYPFYTKYNLKYLIILFEKMGINDNKMSELIFLHHIFLLVVKVLEECNLKH